MQQNIPAYIKTVLILFGVVLALYALVAARQIIAIFTLSAVLSILLLPLNKKLEKLKVPRIPAIFITIFLMFAVLTLICLFAYQQVIRFIKDLKLLMYRATELFEKAGGWFERYLGLEDGSYTQWLTSMISNTNHANNILEITISLTTSAFYFLGLMPVFVFFMLYYREFFKRFILMHFKQDNHRRIILIIKKIELVVRNYLTGMLIVISLISALNILGLTLLGIKFAFFFGLLAGILNIIPYIGVFIGSLLPITYTFITEGSLVKALGVMGIMWIIQFLEGNFITPNIVGSKVRLNPFAAILAVIIGGQLWGPLGMLLFIPLTAVLKVILDSTDSLKPYGYILGEPEEVLKKRKKLKLRGQKSTA